MKLEIDLTDILYDHQSDATESLSDSIRRQVVESIKKDVKHQIQAKINEETAKLLNEALQREVTEKLPKLFEDVFDGEYTIVGRWGEKERTTTFRKELLLRLQEEMVFKPSNDRYNQSNENTFTKAVRATVEHYTKQFQTEFNKTVDSVFVKTVTAGALAKLEEKFAIKG